MMYSQGNSRCYHNFNVGDVYCAATGSAGVVFCIVFFKNIYKKRLIISAYLTATYTRPIFLKKVRSKEGEVSTQCV